MGKFKNRKAEVKGFKTDDKGQPVLKTTKGDQKLFKPRITKLMPAELQEYIKSKPSEKLWIHPDSGKMVKLKHEHHTQHAFQHPEKYGLSGNIFGDHEYEKNPNGLATLWDEYVGGVMFENGWVRYHEFQAGDAQLQGQDFKIAAKALQWLRKNNREFNSVYVATDDESYIELDNPHDIKTFAQTGKKPISRTSQFREATNKSV